MKKLQFEEKEIPINVSNNFVSWFFDGREIIVKCNKPISVMAYTNKNRILIISENNERIGKLLVFNLDGKLIIELSPPNGFSFSFVAKHTSKQPCVVCGSEKNEIDGWYDWHFILDEKTNELIRSTPSY